MKLLWRGSTVLPKTLPRRDSLGAESASLAFLVIHWFNFSLAFWEFSFQVRLHLQILPRFIPLRCNI